jgi:xanthine dehydrogenase accessory factor
MHLTPTHDRDPVQAILASDEDAVLAIITGVEGPSYRPIGALMAVFDERRHTGTLSSGCIESDISLHAMRVLDTGAPEELRYGAGSPFADIKLPCGGGMDIALVPRPDRTVLTALAERRAARQPCTLEIDLTTGAMALAGDGDTGKSGATMRIRFVPEVRFLVFGKGPEAATFAALAQSAGYPNLLISPDQETLDEAAAAGCATRHILSKAVPADITADCWTAIVLFFHDHEWEPPILQPFLASDAFYIGAQGSRGARRARNLELQDLGIPPDQIARLRGPIGLIPSARDARTLAISVLAEVMAERHATRNPAAAAQVSE